MTVLVLAPRGRDADLTARLLSEANITATPCESADAICHAIEVGDSDAALVTEEALTPPVLARLHEALSAQPPWSDFPIIVFTRAFRGEGVTDAHLRSLGNVTLLDRPVNVRTMLAAVRAALRGRRRQYEGRDAIRARDQFLAMLGHELRNPLGAIRFAVELLEVVDDPHTRSKHRDVIDRQSRHLTRLVDDLLDVARVTNGKIALHTATVQLDEVLRTVFQSYEHVARANDLRLTFSTTGPLPVDGDRVRLEQVFGNLLANAMKYTRGGGTVRIEATRDGAAAIVRVIDTGIGIDGAMLGRVFELFAQADRTLDRAQGGLGIGLTLVRSLIRLHGGDVEAHSDGIGHGSEFRVQLPLKVETASDAAPRPQPTEHERASKKRVVIVEDSDDNRELLEELLRLEGHDVWTAGDGPTGADRILELQPDLALVDIGLPGCDGYEVARRVRAAGGAAVTLVALTGYGQNEDRTTALDAGFDLHLTKPVGLSHMQALFATPPRSAGR